MKRIFVHVSDPDILWQRYKNHIVRTQNALGSDKVPSGEDHLVAVDYEGDGLPNLIDSDADVVRLPRKQSAKVLKDTSAAKLAHLGIKKNASAYEAFSAVYAATNSALFDPDL